MRTFLRIFARVLRNVHDSTTVSGLFQSQIRTFAMMNIRNKYFFRVYQMPRANLVTSVESCVSLEMNLPGSFNTELTRSHLRALIALVQSEADHGRWSVDVTKNEPNSVDSLLIQPLSRAWNLKATAIWQLIHFICSTGDQLLSACHENVSSNDVNYIRLELLNPARVTVDLFDPLSHIGIRQPQKLLSECPSLLLASAIPSHTPNDQWKRPIKDRKATVLLEALDELGSLLDRNDLVILLNRFPEVLLRSRQELSEIYKYLTENMSLQSSELARATQMRAHRHSLRKATGLRLVSCPAWRLPLSKVRARHLLAVFAGCWPPSQSSQSGITGNQRLFKLLTVPAKQVPQWLNSFTPNEDVTDRPESSHPDVQGKASVFLTKDDVKAFENLILQISFDDHDAADRQMNEQYTSLCLAIPDNSEYETSNTELTANSHDE